MPPMEGHQEKVHYPKQYKNVTREGMWNGKYNNDNKCLKNYKYYK